MEAALRALENGSRRRELAKAVVGEPTGGGQSTSTGCAKRDRGDVMSTPSTRVTPDGKAFKDDASLSQVCPRTLSFSSCLEGRFSSFNYISFQFV